MPGKTSLAHFESMEGICYHFQPWGGGEMWILLGRIKIGKSSFLSKCQKNTELRWQLTINGFHLASQDTISFLYHQREECSLPSDDPGGCCSEALGVLNSSKQIVSLSFWYGQLLVGGLVGVLDSLERLRSWTPFQVPGLGAAMADEKQTRSPESVFVDSVHLSLASWIWALG